jgi:hypothetical protein
MPEERFKVRLPIWAWTELDRIARERGCSRNDLFVEQVGRLSNDPEFYRQMDLKLSEVLRQLWARNRDVNSWPWPKDACEALAVGFLLVHYWEEGCTQSLLTMSEEKLAVWDDLVKHTGKTL